MRRIVKLSIESQLVLVDGELRGIDASQNGSVLEMGCFTELTTVEVNRAIEETDVMAIRVQQNEKWVKAIFRREPTADFLFSSKK